MTTVRYAHHLDIAHNELRNAHLQHVAGLPAATAELTGWLLFNTMDGRAYYCTGTSWEWRATNSDALGGNNAAFYLNRTNHTGTQPAASISGLDGVIAATPLNTLAAPTGPVNLGNQRLISAAPAQDATDVPTLGQVSDLLNNQGFKIVRVASVASVALTIGNGTVMDGVTLATGNLILLKDQASAAENGIYRVNAASLTRDPASDTAAELPGGTIVVAQEGTANADKMWMLITNNPYVMGTDPLNFTPYGNAPNPYVAGNGINITANTISAVAGSGITVGGSGIAVDTATVARYVNLDVPAPGSGTAVTLVHNLARRPVPVAVMEVSTGDLVIPGINYPDANSVTLDFTVAPTTGQYRVAVG